MNLNINELSTSDASCVFSDFLHLQQVRHGVTETTKRLESAYLRMQSAITAKGRGTLLRCVVPKLGMKEIRWLIILTKSLRL